MITDGKDRTDADALLERVRMEEETGRGRLRVFFGYAAGVGKTYTMLEAARARKAEGTDVVAGYVERHARPETLALLEGIPSIEPAQVLYRGITVSEPDFDAILKRRPALVLIDELAHTNAPGMRHAKRHQYIDELLNAGIDVYTTLNVQHLESIIDIVASITGIIVRETVPDDVFFDAWEVEFVDVEPAQLLERFRAGKIYRTDQAHRAMERFFSLNNITVLRELALRLTADHVAQRVERERRSRPGQPVWAVSERVLVAVGGSPWSARLVRAAKRLASSLHAPWIALHIITHTSFATATNRERVRSVLRLAESLGGETAVVRGEFTAKDILAFARSRNVTKIVMGKESRRGRFLRLFRPSIIDSLLGAPGEIDVYLVHGNDADAKKSESPEREQAARNGPGAAKRRFSLIARTVLIQAAVLLASFVAQALLHTEANVIILHLLGIFLAAALLRKPAGLVGSILAVLQFNFFFTEPRFTLLVYDFHYIPVFISMLIVGLATSSLASRLRTQNELTRTQEARTYQLYLLGQALADALMLETVLEESTSRLARLYSMEVSIYLPGKHGLELRASSANYPKEKDNSVAAEWAFANGKPSGHGTDTLSAIPVRYEPLRSGETVIGIAGIVKPDTKGETEEALHLTTALSLVANAVERERLLEERRRATVEAETERMRSTLLRSVSHDLRTPLSGIAGSAEALLYGATEPETVKSIALDIETEAYRLSLLVDNILNLTRLSEDPTRLLTSTESTDDLLYAAAETARQRYRDRKISVRLSGDPSVVDVDPRLIQQALLNYIDNADKYSPKAAPIELLSEHRGNEVRLVVRDYGNGVPADMRSRIFEKFVRIENTDDTSRGSGLGLFICATIARANGGKALMEPAEPHGSRFVLALPLAGMPQGGPDG